MTTVVTPEGLKKALYLLKFLTSQALLTNKNISSFLAQVLYCPFDTDDHVSVYIKNHLCCLFFNALLYAVQQVTRIFSVGMCSKHQIWCRSQLFLVISFGKH